MLARKYRIRKKKDFEKVFVEGSTFVSRFFIVKTRENGLSFPRFAFVAPLKVSKSAVARNKTKRKAREAVRSFFPLIKKTADIIFIAREDLREKSFREIKNGAEEVLKKAQLM